MEFRGSFDHGGEQRPLLGQRRVDLRRPPPAVASAPVKTHTRQRRCLREDKMAAKPQGVGSVLAVKAVEKHKA